MHRFTLQYCLELHDTCITNVGIQEEVAVARRSGLAHTNGVPFVLHNRTSFQMGGLVVITTTKGGYMVPTESGATSRACPL